MNIRFALTVCLAIFSLQSFGQGLNYNYAELRYLDTDVNGADGDGFKFAGSYRLNEDIILVGGYSGLDFDGNVDISTLEFGAGWVRPFDGRQNLDFVGTLSLLRTEVDAGPFDDSDTGFRLTAGVRALLQPQIELRGSIQHVNVEDNDTFLEVAGDYYFAPNFAAGASLEFGGDADTFTIGGRFFFR